MRLAQFLRVGVLGLLGVLVVGLVLAGEGSAGALGAGFQPVPGKETVYVTRLAREFQDGAILKLEDLSSGTFAVVVEDLYALWNIICGPDGRLYVNEHGAQTPEGQYVNRILRFNQDGSGRTLIAEWAEWKETDLTPMAMVFAPNGDLYFGTVGEPQQGIWRIPGVLQADQQFNPPQQVLPPASFLAPQSGIEYWAEPYAFLTSGPFQGDLLIKDTPDRDGVPGGRVLRAPQPGFNTVFEFIPAHTEPGGQPFRPSSIAINSLGNVFTADWANGKVLRYGPDGTAKGVFVSLERANQIAIGPGDLVYITNFAGNRGRLHVFDSEGKQLGMASIPNKALRGVTVCAPK